MKNPFLIGQAIYLRPLERDDAVQLEAWINHPEVWPNLLRYRPLNFQNEIDFIDHLAHSEAEIALGIALKDGDVLIGTTGLHPIDWKNRHAGFGIQIGDKAYWGQGYGTEATRLIVDYAFGVLNLHRVWLHVYEYNLRGRRAYEKVGFVQEGILRQEHYHGGRYWDKIVMGILRTEWQNPEAVAL